MFNERVLVEAWQHPRLRQLKLTTTAGQELKVLYPGTYGRGGPDFREAVLLLGGRRVQGDVEVDFQGQGWQRHGHHQNPAFNRVVLQVVYRADARPAWRQQGEGVAVLPLGAFLSWEEMEGWGPCGQVGVEMVEGWGEERFRAKAKAFSQELAAQKVADQVLLEGVLGALGYARNQGPMAELARGLSWPALAQEIKVLSSAQAQVWLLNLFQERARGLSWQLWGLRPVNHPWRRLEAASHLLVRYRPGLVAGFQGLLTGVKAIERGLMVPRLLGPGRAGEMAVNILLPFFFALGEERALDLFKAYPKLEENEVSRLMRRRLRLRGEVPSAGIQQGLLHHYKIFCQEGRCGECLAQLKVGGNIQVPAMALALAKVEIATGGDHGGVVGA